jgi:hypothetical protein
MPLIHYSKEALEYQNTLRLCDNFCGAWLYYPPWSDKPINAEKSKNNSLHENTCSRLLGTWMIAGASNWFPDYSFLHKTEKLIEGIIRLEKKELTIKQFLELIHELYETAISLDGSLHARKVKNEGFRQQWKQEKESKKAERATTMNK